LEIQAVCIKKYRSIFKIIYKKYGILKFLLHSNLYFVKIYVSMIEMLIWGELAAGMAFRFFFYFSSFFLIRFLNQWKRNARIIYDFIIGGRIMFEKGEYVVYGQNGICMVEDTTTLSMPDVKEGKLYYVLIPQNTSGGKIYSPVENGKVIMRRILTGQEANELIDSMPDIKELKIADDRGREEIYKKALRTCDCKEWVKVIKTLYARGQERKEHGRKMTSTDERYFRQAEDNLFAELSMALHIEKNEVSDFIMKRMEEKEERLD